jgi:nucleotide-binding universal stress UspA family protein
MSGFQTILVPVDFSERSKAICPYVRVFSEHFHAKVTLLHVMQLEPGAAGYSVDPSYPVMFDSTAHTAKMREILKQRLAEHFDVPGVGQIVEQGDPADRIAEYAAGHGIDLIMLPTHGYGKFRSLLLGSVTSKVLHDADCAVWTAPHAEDPAMKAHWPCRNVLVAVGNVSTEQAPVLRRAAEVAESLGATMRLVHALPGAEHQPWEFGGDEFAHFLMERGGEDVATLQAAAGTSVEASIMAGGIGPVVRQVAEAQHADLLIIGRGVMHESLGRLRSQSYEIIRQSPCPVLSL